MGFYLSEVCRCGEDWSLAEIAYQRTIQIEPGYAMGLASCWNNAVQRHRQYLAAAPNNLMVLYKLSGMWLVQGCPDIAYMRDLETTLGDKMPQFTLDASQGQIAGWTLVGYDVYELRLIRGELADLWLYWLPPSP